MGIEVTARTIKTRYSDLSSRKDQIPYHTEVIRLGIDDGIRRICHVELSIPKEGDMSKLVVLAPGWTESAASLAKLRRRLARRGISAVAISHARRADLAVAPNYVPRHLGWLGKIASKGLVGIDQEIEFLQNVGSIRRNNILGASYYLNQRDGYKDITLAGHSLGATDVTMAASADFDISQAVEGYEPSEDYQPSYMSMIGGSGKVTKNTFIEGNIKHVIHMAGAGHIPTDNVFNLSHRVALMGADEAISALRHPIQNGSFVVTSIKNIASDVPTIASEGLYVARTYSRSNLGILALRGITIDAITAENDNVFSSIGTRSNLLYSSFIDTNEVPGANHNWTEHNPDVGADLIKEIMNKPKITLTDIQIISILNQLGYEISINITNEDIEENLTEGQD